jgi:mitochondrial inner membrane protease subunit 1
MAPSFTSMLPSKSFQLYMLVNTILEVGLVIGQMAIVSHVFIRYVGGISQTQGVSMLPTMPAHFNARPRILWSRLHRRGRGIKVGDVITYTHPMFPQDEGCKRVIGMPGDFVSVITPGRRDDDIEEEDVDGKWARVKEEVIQVPEGHCWIAGDNLDWSRDSRLFGPLPLGLVRGKVLAVVTPWRDAKWLGADVDVKDAQVQEHEWVVR